jgi:endonuclease VIII
MEGPSIHLAAEQLRPFVRHRIQSVSGNSKIGIERLRGKRVKDIFAWGKHLVFQCEVFAIRVHFLLWGTFAAVVDGQSVTGDYRRSSPPRLMMTFRNGDLTIWSASIKFIESDCARANYDFTADVLSPTWSARKALARMRRFPDDQIADVLLDQSVFAGVGNIIKNEVLFRTGTSPFATVAELSPQARRAIAHEARAFSLRFLELRRQFALRKHLEIYGRRLCTRCGGRVSRRVHGLRHRRSFYCPTCQAT